MIPPDPPTSGSPAASPQEPSGPGEPFRLLFVCTGNTCRSPLAEALTRRKLTERGWRQVEVRSAGVGAFAGSPASEGALRVAARHGLDLSQHRSGAVDEETVAWADLVLTMSPGHLAAVRSLPGTGNRASLITAFAAGDPPSSGAWQGSVPDPIGMDEEGYETTFRLLDGLIDRILDRIEPLVDP